MKYRAFSHTLNRRPRGSSKLSIISLLTDKYKLNLTELKYPKVHFEQDSTSTTER